MTMLTLKIKSRSLKSDQRRKKERKKFLKVFPLIHVSVPVGQNMAICSEYRIEVEVFHGCMTLIMTLVSGDLKNRSRSLKFLLQLMSDLSWP